MLRPTSPADRQSAARRFRFLAEAAAWRYRAQGHAVRWAVLGRLLGDPFYREWLAATPPPAEGLLLDVGCGRGVGLALWASAQALGMAGGGKRGEEALRLAGIEARPNLAESARLALGEKADIITADWRDTALPRCHVAALQDTLLFLEPDAQDLLLERLAAALAEGGLLILREVDADAFGHKFGLRIASNALGLFRGGQAGQLYPRSGEDWKKRLEALGLRVEARPLESGTGVAQALLLARKSGGDAAANE